MINISTPWPTAWTPSASPPTSAVAAVIAVRPAKDSGRHTQSGADPQVPSADLARQRSESAREAAPMLPHKSAQDAATAVAASREPSHTLSRADTQQLAQQEADEQAAKDARHQQLKAVLTNVWKASAAVVDRVLARDDGLVAGAPANATLSGAPAEWATRGSNAEQLSLPWPVMPQQRELPAALNEGRAPMAYDERGISNLMPLEPGALISHRV